MTNRNDFWIRRFQKDIRNCELEYESKKASAKFELLTEEILPHNGSTKGVKDEDGELHSKCRHYQSEAIPLPYPNVMTIHNATYPQLRTWVIEYLHLIPLSYVPTSRTLPFLGLVTIQASHEPTLAADPVDIKQCCFTRITHLPDTAHCSFPGNFGWNMEKAAIKGKHVVWFTFG